MFKLIHNITGYTTGGWLSYELADSIRLMLDDWMNWTVIHEDDI